MDEIEISDIKTAIRSLRASLGLTQERFARRMGIVLRTAVRWENSEELSPPALTSLRRMAALAGNYAAAAFFAKLLRDQFELEWAEDDHFQWTPHTPDEIELVAEFLRLYREGASTIEPFTEYLRGSRAQLEIGMERAMRSLKPVESKSKTQGKRKK